MDVEAQPLPVNDVDAVLFVAAGELPGADFDEATHTWNVGNQRARVVVATDGALPAAFACRADDLMPYLGVAVAGVPNYFLLTGPDLAAQKGYIAKCLAHLERSGGTRIEVRSSTQRYFSGRSRGPSPRPGRFWRKVGRRIPSAFEVRALSDGFDDDLYEGPAEVRIGSHNHPVHARLAGRLDPIDGRYHWQGMIFDNGLDVRLPQPVTVSVAGRTADARLTERTPWSTFSVVGVGAPPYALADPAPPD